MSLRLLGLHFRKENDFIPTNSFSDVGSLLYDKKGKDTVYRKTENERQGDGKEKPNDGLGNKDKRDLEQNGEEREEGE